MFGGGRSFILTIGDEAIILSRMAHGRLIEAYTLPAEPSAMPEDILRILQSDATAPVYVLLDVMEQYYKDDPLPLVPFWERPALIRRHLGMAYPGNGVKAAIPLNKAGRSYFHLLMGAPETDRLAAWFSFVDQLTNPFGGIYLLPYESLGLAGSLLPDGGKGLTGHRWVALIGYDRSGGFRQIVEKNGRLAMSRLTHTPLDESQPDVCVEDILRDFKATLGYVRRMGYVDQDVLDVVIVTSEPILAILRDKDWREARFVELITPEEAGKQLNLGKTAVPDQPGIADLLHAAWFGAKRRKGQRVRRADADPVYAFLEMAGKSIATITVCLCLAATAFTVNKAYGVMQEKDRIATYESEKRQLQKDVADAKKQSANLPHDPTNMRRLLALGAALSLDAPVVLPDLINGMAGAFLPFEMVVGDLTIRTEDQMTKKTRRKKKKRKAGKKSGLFVECEALLPRTVLEPEHALTLAEKGRQALTDIFPDMTVSVLRQPIDIDNNRPLTGSISGHTGRHSTDDPYSVLYQLTREAAK